MAGRLQQPAEKFGDYTTSGILGEGSFGKVYMAKSSDRRIVALKVIHLKKFSQLDEGDFATTLQHDNIVKVFDTFRCVKEQEDGEKNHYLVIVMEMFQKGWNVSWLLKQTIDDDILFQLAKDVGSALKYIHEKGYIHRDIKPDNILIDEFYHYFVSDFGLSKKAVEAGTCNGTEFYMAPEVWNRWDKRYGEGTPYGPPADMWSLGMTLFVVATGTVSDGVPLFVKYEDSQEFEKHIESELVRGNGGSIAPSIQQLIRRLLRFNPEDRITAAELVHEIASPEDQLELQPSPVDILSRNGLINEDGDDDSQQESRDSISLQTVFEKAIDLFPDSPEGYCALGHMLDPNIPDVCKHRTDLFVKAIARDPNNYFAFRSLAENAAHSPIIQGIRMSRMCLYKRVITLRPSDREARLGLAELYEDGEKVKLENSEIISKEQLQQGGGEDDADPLDCQYKLYALYCILIVSQKKSYDPMRLVEMLRAIPPLKEEELDILTPMDWNMFTIPPLNILKTPQQLCRVMNEVIPLQYSRQYLMEELLKQGDDGLPACKELMKTATGAINLQTIVDCDPPPSSEIQAFLLQQEWCCPHEWRWITVVRLACREENPNLKASLEYFDQLKAKWKRIGKWFFFFVWLMALVGICVFVFIHRDSHDIVQQYFDREWMSHAMETQCTFREADDERCGVHVDLSSDTNLDRKYNEVFPAFRGKDCHSVRELLGTTHPCYVDPYCTSFTLGGPTDAFNELLMYCWLVVVVSVPIYWCRLMLFKIEHVRKWFIKPNKKLVAGCMLFLVVTWFVDLLLDSIFTSSYIYQHRNLTPAVCWFSNSTNPPTEVSRVCSQEVSNMSSLHECSIPLGCSSFWREYVEDSDYKSDLHFISHVALTCVRICLIVLCAKMLAGKVFDTDRWTSFLPEVSQFSHEDLASCDRVQAGTVEQQYVLVQSESSDSGSSNSHDGDLSLFSKIFLLRSAVTFVKDIRLMMRVAMTVFCFLFLFSILFFIDISFIRYILLIVYFPFYNWALPLSICGLGIVVAVFCFICKP
eukprot:TRINITY_DN2767_c0_g1_i11.p1 TRINITY_DN2767_c0_g1~~TRINITY_DN2767_c0_g1_i11.p1  ORF type:complete len:1035 (+),score=153.44 TRINITY_DN2767_c0_g1_i11:619-3723(+)